MSIPPPPGPDHPDRPGATGPDQSGWGVPPSAGYGQQGRQEPPNQYGQPGQQYGQPGQYGQYGTPTGPQPGLPPPAPGIIPLRPLRLGDIYEGAFKAIRTNPVVMFVLSGIVVTLLAIVSYALTAGSLAELQSWTPSDPESLTQEDLDAMVSSLSSALASTGLGALVSMVVTTLLTGLLMQTVSQAVIGRKLSLAEAWRESAPMFVRLLGLTVLVTLIIVAPIVLAVLLGMLAIAGLGGMAGAAILLLLVLLALAAMLFLMTVTLLATPALMLERAGIGSALRRGWRLGLRAFWRVLGIYLLTSIIIMVVVGMISTPGATLAALASPTVAMVVTVALSAIVDAFTTPFLASVVALLYIDQRIRYEGLDVELAAASRSSGG